MSTTDPMPSAEMVFDTLFGQDSKFGYQPQMLEGAVTDQDGKRWTLKLRDGLKFHDGSPVLARDCVGLWRVAHSRGPAYR